ncbi:major facilitator superfamily domain-containing protein [Poronia punctata]|nr:major facilitator superfamily domain-containing protein [Poronia punctata]
MGTVLSAADFGAFFAPALGGLLYQRFGISAVLAATCIVAIIALLFGGVVPGTADTKQSEGEGVESGNPEITEYTSLLPADNSAFVLPPSDSKLYQAFPIIRCFREPSLVVSIFLVLVSAIFVSVFDATIPLHARHTFGFDSMDIGLLFIPMAVARVVTGPIGGWMVDKTSPRTVALTGYALLTPVFISLRWVKSEPREVAIGLYFALLALAGIGSAIVSVPSLVESSSVLDRYYQANPGLFGDRPPAGALFGIFLAAFGAGSAVGPVIAGALRNSIGYGNMNAVMAGISAAAAVAAFIWLERVPAKQSPIDEA